MTTRTKPPKEPSIQTKAKILDTALRLFNDSGTAAVSTNLIAAEAGISPGNLYYHYRDKKQIIRELFARYANEFTDRWRPTGVDAIELGHLRHAVEDGVRIAWAYRFFDRELVALLVADAILRDEYRRVYRRRLDEWIDFAAHLVDRGLLRTPRGPRDHADLALAIWLIGQNWLSFMEITEDDWDDRSLGRGADLVFAVIEPHLTASGRRSLSTSDKTLGGTKKRGGAS